MKKYLNIDLPDNAKVIIEVSDELLDKFEEGVTLTGVSEKVKEGITKGVSEAVELTSIGIDKVAKTISNFSVKLLDGFKEIPKEKKPTDIEIEYGVQFMANADIIKLASISGKGNLKIKVSWKNKE